MSVLDAGGVAALPAEGLYGYHARPDRPAGLALLRSVKSEKDRRGWIGLIADPAALERYAAVPAGRALALAREYWPGALTIVINATSEVPEALRSADGSVALRCPGNEFLRAVVGGSGGFLISTSANAPGLAPPSRAEDIAWVEIDLVVDMGPLSGVPSTIVRVIGEEIVVLRKGAVCLRGGAT